MQSRKRSLSAVLTIWLTTLALFFALEPPTAEAQMNVPPPVNVNVPLIQQETPVWCWLAVAEMLMRYRNLRSVRQCQILEIGHGLPPGTCCGNMRACMRPGGFGEIQMILQNFGNIRTQISGPIPAQMLYSILQTGRPVIISINTGMSTGHVIVIRGMRWQPQMMMTPRGPMMAGFQPVLLINDPLSYFPAEVPYQTIIRVWTNSLVPL